MLLQLFQQILDNIYDAAFCWLFFIVKFFFYLKAKYLEKKYPNCISNIAEKMVMTRDKQIFSELFIWFENTDICWQCRISL